VTPLFRPSGLVSENELRSAVQSVEDEFPLEIERIRYTVHDDWSDDPAVFFRVLLKDNPDLMTFSGLDDPRFVAAFELSSRITSALRTAVEAFRLPSYFAFRWVSEQKEIDDPDWK
jgi:hypothetical protein